MSKALQKNRYELHTVACAFADLEDLLTAL